MFGALWSSSTPVFRRNLCVNISTTCPIKRRSTLGLGRLRFAARREYHLACNWKVFVDNYLDGGYHINTIHPGLAGLIDYSQYRTKPQGNTCLQSGPLQSDAGALGAEKTRTGTAYYWWVFPNLMLNVYAETMDVNFVLPDGPDR